MELIDTSSTRKFDTLFGEKTYREVSDLIAEPLRLLLDDIASGQFTDEELNVDLLRHFHHRVLVEVMPDIAGRWRACAVRVGNHYPPEHMHVDRLMREFFLDFAARLAYSGDDVAVQLEALAYAEAHTLHIHPFEDFNGRAARALVAEAMRRVDFPVLDLSVERETPEHDEYVAALRVYDEHKVLVPLCDFWRNMRFTQI